MNPNQPHHKVEVILDTAEKLYADTGAEALTVRLIAETAGVNLAAINYHFRSKDNLIKAMLNRRLSPLHKERLALLHHFTRAAGPDLSTEHIVAAILIPGIHRMSLASAPAYLERFYLRSAADPTPAIRDPMQEAFGSISQTFDDAFCRINPADACHDVLMMVHIFFNAYAGSIANHNTLLLLQELMKMPHFTVASAVSRFASVLSVRPLSGETVSNLRVSKIICDLEFIPELAHFYTLGQATDISFHAL